MNIIRATFISIGLIGIFSCANDTKNSALEVISIYPLQEKYNLFSDILTDVSYLPLSVSTPLVGEITKIIPIEEGYLILSSGPDAVFLFDKNGQFVRTIGREGEGPGEYASIKDIHYDAKQKEIIVLDRTQLKFLHYELNGTFKFDNSLPVYASSFFVTPQHYFLYCGSEISAETDTRLVVLDRSNSTIQQGFLEIDPMQAKFLNFFDKNNFTLVEDSLRFFYGFNDTIYHVNEQFVEPRFVIDFQPYDVPEEIMQREYASAYEFITYLRSADYAFRVIGYQENSTHCIFGFEFRERFLMCVYNKNTKAYKLVNLLEDDQTLKGFLLDDMFTSIPYVLEEDGTVIIVNEGEALKRYMDEQSAEAKAELMKSPQFSALSGQGDNPVFIFGKVRL